MPYLHIFQKLYIYAVAFIYGHYNSIFSIDCYVFIMSFLQVPVISSAKSPTSEQSSDVVYCCIDFTNAILLLLLLPLLTTATLLSLLFFKIITKQVYIFKIPFIPRRATTKQPNKQPKRHLLLNRNTLFFYMFCFKIFQSNSRYFVLIICLALLLNLNTRSYLL